MSDVSASAPALRNPWTQGAVSHPSAYRLRRVLNWFPLGVGYALLYMGRYNLTVAQGALGDMGLMSKADFGAIFMWGAIVYGVAFLFNGPLTDRIGGKRSMLLGLGGACLANLAMGAYVQWLLSSGDMKDQPVRLVLILLYAVNMYFQSFGAVAIVKVNSSWFHVRERGSFSGIFGIMISSGLLLAFDLNEYILSAITPSPRPADFILPGHVVFFVPAVALALIFVVEVFLLRDHPSEAGHQDIETGDASSGEAAGALSTRQLYARIFTNPVIMTVAAIEFCTGVLRNGVMHWFRIYAKEQVKLLGGAVESTKVLILGVFPFTWTSEPWTFTLENWGKVLFLAGILGGTTAGFVSDWIFGSRRAPVAGLFYGLVCAAVLGMVVTLKNPVALCVLVFLISLAVIGTHGLLSGTATMDFGGRKGAATAVGVIDGFVYLGTALQSGALGWITSQEGGWSYWPWFLLPWGVIGLLLLFRIWKAIPQGKKAAAH